MKKVLMLIAMVLGTTVMVNAQTEPAKTAQSKEVKTKMVTKEVKAEPAKKAKKVKTVTKTETKAEAAPVKMETAKAKK